MNRKQHIVQFHVENLMGIHVDKKVNDEFDVCLNNIYGGYGNVKTMHRHVHNYLRMTFYFSDKYKLKIDMINYMNAMVNDLYIKFNPNDTILDPENGDFFSVGNSEDLRKYKAQLFRTFFQKDCLHAKAHVLIFTPQLQCYVCAFIVPMRINGRNYYNYYDS